MSTTARPVPKPPSIRRGLAAVDRRLRAVAATRGTGRLALVLSIGAALGMAADFLWPLPTSVRWLIWLGWVGAGLALLGLGVVRPWTRRISPAELAALAERANPEGGERLISAVELLDPMASPQGSPELIAALANLAEARAVGLRPDRIIDGRSSRRWLIAGLAVLGLFALPPIVKPDPFGSLARRFLLPWADVPRIDRLAVTVLPGDARAAIGSEVAFRAEVAPRFGGGPAPKSARLAWTDADGRSHQAAMTAEGPAGGSSRAFSYVLKGLSDSIRYRVEAGPATSDEHRIEAVEPPSIQNLSIRIEPPAYTGRPAFDPKDTQRISAWEGSRVHVRLVPSVGTTRATLDWPTGDGVGRVVSLKSGKEWGFLAEVQAEASGTFAFRLEDGEGISSRSEMPRWLRVEVDEPPVVTLGGADAVLESTAEDVLLVDTKARDDVAVARAAMCYAITRADVESSANPARPEEGRTAARLDGLGTPGASGQAALVLGPLALKPGDEVAYWVEVADNRPAPKGPNVAVSTRRTLRIVDKAEPLAARQAEAERSGLRERLEALAKAAAANHQAAVPLRYAADAALRGTGPWDDARARALADRQAEARRLVDGLNELARDLLDAGRFAALSRPARQAADVEAEAARRRLERAVTTSEPARRLAELRQADAALDAAKTRVADLLRRFDELARQDDARRKLGLLAARQDELADRAESADPAELEAIREEQEQLRREVDDLTRRSPELKAEVLARRAEQAEALAKRARELADRQREEARRTADPEGLDGPLGELAREQQAIEEEARRLALQADPVLQENARGRLNLDPLTRAAEPLARGDAEQARQRLEEARNELARLARDLADLPDDPKAFARRLARRQEDLRQEAERAVREANTPEQKAALADRLKPIAERQSEIARLAAAIPTAPERRGPAEAAVAATARASESFAADPGQAPARQAEARDALNRLADALPDPNQRRQEAQRRLDEARNRMNDVARELDAHLRETATKPGTPGDPVAAARELARRVEPLIGRQDEVAAMLAQLETGPEAEPQRDRAARRAAELADALDAIRQAAPPESAQTPPMQPIVGWHLLGPFPRRAEPPFDLTTPIDLAATHPDRMRRPASWAPAQAGHRGLIDLNAAFPDAGQNASAFAVATVDSPAAGPGRLLIGSDDDITVWVNGGLVFQFGGDRSFAFDQDAAAVDFAEGSNRVLVRCGNGSSEWKFAVSVAPPPTADVARRLARMDQLRRSVPPTQVDARAALDRLQQRLWNREPADAVAEALAAEARALAEQARAPNAEVVRPLQAEEARRLAAAIRSLEAPDAPAPQAEAARLAEEAARILAGEPPSDREAPAADPAQAAEQAARAVEALARRLAGEQDRPEALDQLAEAQRALDEIKDPTEAARAQRNLADDLARIPPEPGPARDEAEAAMAEAVAQAERAAAEPANAPDPAEQAAARERAAEAVESLARRPEAEPSPEVAEAGQPEGKDQPAEPGRPAGPKAEAKALADRQRDLATEASKPEPPVGKPTDPPAPSGAGRQEALADAALSIPLPPEGSDPARRAEAERRRAEAARAQARAAEAIRRGEPDKAAEESARAAEALDRLAEALPEGEAAAPPSLPPDPELGLDPALADAASELAARERRLQERLAAVLGERLPDQEELRAEARELGRELAELREQSRDLSPRSQGPANQAAGLLQNQAPEAMGRGMDHLGQGRRDAARDAQRQAADHVEHAARAAADLVAALRADIPADAQAQAGGDDPSGEGGEPADLASARDAQRRAAGQLDRARQSGAGQSQDQPGAASESMRQAAQGLRAASRGRPGDRADSEMASSPDPSDQPGTAVDAHLGPIPAELANDPRARRRWGELPGHLRSEILQMSQGGYREEYARLIQLYFREIAAGGPED